MSLWQSLNQCSQLYPETRKLEDLEIKTRSHRIINLVEHLKSKGKELIICKLCDPETQDISSVFLPKAFAVQIKDNIASFGNELRSYNINPNVPKAGGIVFENGEACQD
ncbi:hypothetical protein QAD02_007261 [Eretmocerus hayati]|uniref:Uncharacterized protein n=1 Tax=Eretmocerus hayati TaxID=131215 RepID=A0ACC2N5J4_9HYME|nr:hypothetical protein QAD02_007261 [Eretmocerus hayati]